MSLSAVIRGSDAVPGATSGRAAGGQVSSYLKSLLPRRERPESLGRGALANGLPPCALGRPRCPGLPVTIVLVWENLEGRGMAGLSALTAPDTAGAPHAPRPQAALCTPKPQDPPGAPSPASARCS